MKALKCAALLLAGALVFSGCHKEKTAGVSSEPDKPPEPVEEPDPNWPAKAGTVVLEEQPQTVVSLSPALTEIVYELGGSLSGVSEYCDYPAEAAALDHFGTADTPDMDALKKLSPDLILSSAPLAEADAAVLEEAGAALAVFPRAEGLDGMEETYVSIATLLGGAIDGKENGETVFGRLWERYDALVSGASPSEASGIWLRAVPLVMATGDTFEGKLLTEVLGLQNDAAEFTGWQYPAEKAVDLYPDVIFYDGSIDPEYFKGTQVYNTTDAYKQNRMYAFSSLPFERQSGRMFDELERMAKALAGEETAAGIDGGNADAAAASP